MFVATIHCVYRLGFVRNASQTNFPYIATNLQCSLHTIRAPVKSHGAPMFLEFRFWTSIDQSLRWFANNNLRTAITTTIDSNGFGSKSFWRMVCTHKTTRCPRAWFCAECHWHFSQTKTSLTLRLRPRSRLANQHSTLNVHAESNFFWPWFLIHRLIAAMIYKEFLPWHVVITTNRR